MVDDIDGVVQALLRIRWGERGQQKGGDPHG